MINTSKKLALIAVLAAMSVASPALAQSFDKSSGTGNELPFAYGPGGTKPAWTVAPENNQVAAAPRANSRQVAGRQTGRNSFAAVGTQGLYNYAGSAPPAVQGNPFSPAETGGGSTGYNELVQTY